MNVFIRKMQGFIHERQHDTRFGHTNLDLDYVCHELEKIGQSAIAKGACKPGFTFPIPIEDGETLEMQIYEQKYALDQILPDGTRQVVIDKDDSGLYEKRALLTMQNTLKTAGFGIGYKFPDRFKTLLQQMNAGDLLASDQGKSYVCVQAHDGEVFLKQVSKNLEHPKLEDFENEPMLYVNTNQNISMQSFYRQMKMVMSDDISCRFLPYYKAGETLNRIYSGLQYGEVKSLTFGQYTYRVTKEPGGYKWFDQNGEHISEQKIKILIGWYAISPVLHEYHHGREQLSSLKDDMFESNLFKILESAKYDMAYDYVREYCTKNPDFIFSLTTYINRTEKYEPVTITFQNVNGECRCFISEYYNGDLHNRKNIIETGQNTFVSFCRQKYAEHYYHMVSEHKEMILEQYPHCKADILQDVISNLMGNKSIFKDTQVNHDLENIHLMESFNYDR